MNVNIKLYKKYKPNQTSSDINLKKNSNFQSGTHSNDYIIHWRDTFPRLYFSQNIFPNRLEREIYICEKVNVKYHACLFVFTRTWNRIFEQILSTSKVCVRVIAVSLVIFRGLATTPKFSFAHVCTFSILYYMNNKLLVHSIEVFINMWTQRVWIFNLLFFGFNYHWRRNICD